MATRHSKRVTRVDGQTEALKLLRCLRELNGHLEKPKLSARLVDYMLRSLSGWPEAERQRFSRVISDWLVTVMLCGSPELEEYEDALSVRRAEADPHFQRFMGKINVGQTPPAA